MTHFVLGAGGRRRRALLLGMLLGCGMAARAADEPAPARPLLTYWSTLSGGFAARADALSGAGRAAGLAGYVQLLQPVAVTARAGFLYLADSGRRVIFRYDPGSQRLLPFADYAPGAAANIGLAPDLSLYVADGPSGMLLQYAADGRLLRKFGSQRALARPVALAVNDATGQIAVADSLYRHVVMFSNLGHVQSTIQPEQAQGIDAMAGGPDGLYLVDRLGRQVLVIGWDGSERYTLGEGELRLPGAIAVDRFNRVFVSDSADNTIKIFVHGQLAASFQGDGAVPPGFRLIAGMAVERNLLYVADSMHARVQTFRIAPPSEKERLQP